MVSCITIEQQESTSTASSTTVQEIAPTDTLPAMTPKPTPMSVVDATLYDICPSTRFVPIQDLNIPAQYRFVALLPTLDKHGDYESGYYLISPGDGESEVVTEVMPPPGTVNHNYELSPEGQWVSFLRWPKEDPSNPTLWVSRLDGKTQWSIKQLEDVNVHPIWISPDELVVIGPIEINNAQSFPPSQYYMPLEVVNPFAHDEQILAPLSREYIEKKQDQLYTVRIKDNLYNLFRLPEDGSYVLFSYGDNIYRTVFTWLSGINPETIRIYHRDDSFISVVTQPNGIDLSSELKLSEIEQQREYTETMKKIVFPAELISLEVSNVLPQSSLVTLYQQTDMFNSIKWFALDYQRMQINNYCFEVPWDASPYSSPDGNFIAFSRGYPEYPDGEIIILNLSTGYVSIIEGYQMVGWGVQQ
jgi:hypothetical protein